MNRLGNIGKRELRSGLIGSLAALLIPLLFWLAPTTFRDAVEQPAIDIIAGLWPAPATEAVVVVDIDGASLAEFEGRSFSRGHLAALIEEITDLGAAAIAIDFVLQAPCDMNDPEMARLVRAIAATTVSAGFLLSGEATEAPPVRSLVAVDTDIQLPRIWRAFGADTSCQPVVDAASGLSTISLAGDFDARVRSAPTVITVGNRPYPSLAVDAVRLFQQAGAVFLVSDPPALQVGAVRARLDRSGDVNLRFSSARQQADRTISARDILAKTVDADRVSDRIVFLGSSAAELGGLRPVPGDPIKPSVQIQADLATNLLLASNPVAPEWAAAFSLIAACLLGAALAFAAAGLRPVTATLIASATLIAWLAFCAVFYHAMQLIFDPVLPVLTMLAGSLASGAVQFSATRRGEALIRQRFEQRLPAEVVSRLVAEPDLLKLQGEQRMATSIFTDVEGFTTTTERIGPVALIELLDRYFEGVTAIVIAHGGMVDRTIGDGMHALFNAPVELERHAEAALACAVDIEAFSETFRSSGPAAEADFGRTRIGIETGTVVLGDVGGGGKVDYAAFGSSVNIAARLQEANKRFGTTILVGPGAHAQIGRTTLRDLGAIELRGIGSMHVYTP